MYENITHDFYSLDELIDKAQSVEDGQWDQDADDYLMVLRALIDAKVAWRNKTQMEGE